MSIEAIAWAFNQKIDDPGAKLTLVAMANNASHEHIWDSSITSLMSATGLGGCAVENCLSYLEGLNLIVQLREVAADGVSIRERYFLRVAGSGEQ